MSLQDLQHIAKQAGAVFQHEIAFDGQPQLTLVDALGRRVCSFAPRTWGLHWVIPGTGIFIIPKVGEKELVLRICDCSKNGATYNWPAMPQKYGLQSVPWNSFRETGKEELRRARELAGWHELDDIDYGRVWGQFCDAFRFRAGGEPAFWPAIIEPKHSKTYDLAPVFEKAEQEGGTFDAPILQTSARRLLEELFVFLQADRYKGGFILIDVQHTSYWCNWQGVDANQLVESAPIGLLPASNYVLGTTDDLTRFVFGHPWEETLCVTSTFADSNFVEKSLGERIRTCRLDGTPLGPLGKRGKIRVE